MMIAGAQSAREGEGREVVCHIFLNSLSMEIVYGGVAAPANMVVSRGQVNIACEGEDSLICEDRFFRVRNMKGIGNVVGVGDGWCYFFDCL